MDMKTGANEEAVLAILPGLLCDHLMFDRQLAAFPGSMAIDGFYGGADTIADMADYALRRLPRRCALLGHSMGARVALEVFRKAPHRITRLALADTGIHPVRPGEREKRYALRDLGRLKGFGALVDAWLPGMIGHERRADPDLYGQLRKMCMGAGQAVFEAQVEALLDRPEVVSLLAKIECPVSVIVGELDKWSPVEQHREIAEAIRHAELHVVSGAGHMAPTEKPEQFNEVLRNWFAQSWVVNS